MSALTQIELEIRKAYTFLREKNNTVPSETLQFMLDASLEKLNNIKVNDMIKDVVKGKSMRDLVLQRIEEIRVREDGFSKSLMRWQGFTHGTENKHIRDIKFEKLNDVELLMLFERLIHRCSKQM